MSWKDHDLSALQTLVACGARPRYLFFWQHTATTTDEIGKECLSQWYASSFELEGLVFETAEHYMMYRKSVLFGDLGKAQQILAAPNPAVAKALGRSVRGFSDAVWKEHRSGICIDGNCAKFSQSPPLREFLLHTKPCVLVEASPVDRVWGIGLAAEHEHASDALKWRGQNLLGFALMTVRDRLEE
jgi:ribA/ribD-fused uncharacterized protein